MDSDINQINPLAKKVDKILNFDLQQDTLNSLINVSDLVLENNLTTRRNLRANIEKQSLLINEQFIGAFQDAYRNFQKLSDCILFIDESCKKMMNKVEELKFQTSDFLKQTSEVNAELHKLDNNEKVLNKFIEEFQLVPLEVSLISSGIDVKIQINDNYFDILQKIKNIHEKAKTLLANKQLMTGFEIMDLMTKYEEMANDKLYHWTIDILRTISLDVIELHSHLFRSIAYLQNKDVLFKHCLDEYITVRRSSISHLFIEALTRGRNSNSTHYPAMELYSHDILRYIGDMLSFLHQTTVSEKDMLNTLLKLCDPDKLAEQNVVKNVLSSITEGLTRPLKIRIENSLISNNKNMLKANEQQIGKTKNYFLVKNVINFYLQTFGKMLLDNCSFLYTIKELLILSDKVFYNSLNYYCSSNISQKFNLSQPSPPQAASANLSLADHLNEFIQLIDEFLESIKSSSFSNVEEQKLETHRILSTVIEPFIQYVMIYSSKLSPIEMTVFGFNCTHYLNQTIIKYKFTEDFIVNLQKQLDENIEVLVNEQFQHIINNLSVTSFYNAILQTDNFTVPMSQFSGCDPIAIVTFLKHWDQFVKDPTSLKLSQIESINDQSTRENIWRRSLKLIAEAYQVIYIALMDPKNKYTDIMESISYKPEDVIKLYCN